MAKRTTIQDIAKELGLSRNTVSKAFNNSEGLADSTRDAILSKASEMGYKLFNVQAGTPSENIISKSEAKEIVLFTGAVLGSSHFSTKMLDEIQIEASKIGFGFVMYRIMKQELEKCKLPANFDLKRTAGVLCVEMFNPEYNNKLCSLGVPVVFIDRNVIYNEKSLNSDLLLMENRYPVYNLIQEMKNRGKTKIGFVGEAFHCQSFYERYEAFRSALNLFDLEFHAEWCIVGKTKGLDYPSREEYIAFLKEQLTSCKKLPDVLLCINDFIAMDVLFVLREMNVAVPSDLYVCGFDDSPDSKFTVPKLTTVHINGQAMGNAALELLLTRIKNPDLPYRTQYIESNIVYRESTNN